MTTTSETIKNIKDIFGLVNSLAKNYSKLNVSGSEEYFKQGSSGNKTLREDIMILEEYYGTPSYLHTYFGKYTIIGSFSSSSQKQLKEYNTKLKDILGLKLIKKGDYEGGSRINKDGIQIPLRTDSMGYYGPYYLVTKIDKKLINNDVNLKRLDKYFE